MSVSISPLETVRRSTAVVGRLSELISSGRLRPGDRFPAITELAQQLKVARSVIRESFVRLEVLGVVEVRHGKGVFVAKVPIAILADRLRQFGTDKADLMRHVWEVREAIETRIAYLAAERRTDRDLGVLQQACDAMSSAIDRDENAVTEDHLFHVHLAHASKNPIFLQVIGNFYTMIMITRKHALRQPMRPHTSLQEHRGILECVASRDKEGAAKAMLEHLAYGRELTLKALAADKETGTE